MLKSIRTLDEGSPYRRPLEIGIFGMLPVLITVWVLASVWANDFHGADFKLQFWVAGWKVLHGASPYAALNQRVGNWPFPYPAAAALLFAPFAVLSQSAGADLYTALCIASPLLALRVLECGIGVSTDWCCSPLRSSAVGRRAM